MPFIEQFLDDHFSDLADMPESLFLRVAARGRAELFQSRTVGVPLILVGFNDHLEGVGFHTFCLCRHVLTFPSMSVKETAAGLVRFLLLPRCFSTGSPEGYDRVCVLLQKSASVIARETPAGLALLALGQYPVSRFASEIDENVSRCVPFMVRTILVYERTAFILQPYDTGTMNNERDPMSRVSEARPVFDA